MKTYLLVFDDGSEPEIDLQKFVDTLDNGGKMFTLDGHVCFIKSNLSVSQLSDRFMNFAGSSLYFIADVTSTDYAGRMPGIFWDDIKQRTLASAAE